MKEAQILDGTMLAKNLNQGLKEEILASCRTQFPTLVTIIVGENEASKIYVASKIKHAKEVGINTLSHHLDNKTSEEQLLNLIKNLNEDKNVHGILVQLPLPSHISEAKIIEAVDFKKDVDGFNPKNLGYLLSNNPYTVACTPLACLYLIEQTQTPLLGANVVIVGRSTIVGKPLAQLLCNHDATVTLCHSKTKNLKSFTMQADIVVAALGKPEFIDDTFIKEGAVVIDVGINRLENKKLCGDVNFAKARKKASFITPVPKGVGPLTIAMLLKNTWNNFLRLKNEQENTSL